MQPRLNAFAMAALFMSLSGAQAPTFRSRSDLIQLDVTVLDRDGRPIRDLTQADFVLLDNGEARPIATFSEVVVPERASSRAPWDGSALSDVRRNDLFSEGRIFVIILDDALSTQGDLWMVDRSKRAAESIVDRLAPSDLAAVVFTRDHRYAQDFTNDRAALRGAIATFNPPAGPADWFRERASLETLRRTIEELAPLRARRKAIVDVTYGVAGNFLETASSPFIPGIPGDPQGHAASLRQSLADSFRIAQLGNTTVYPIDPMGLRVAGGIPGFHLTIAGATGGSAVAGTNDFNAGIARMFEATRSYYLLGFAPPPTDRPQIRRLEVRVPRIDANVRTRSQYVAEPKANDSPAAKPASVLREALTALLPITDVPLQISAAAVPETGGQQAAVYVVLGVRQVVNTGAAEHIERLTAEVMAVDLTGRPRGSERLNTKVRIRQDTVGPVGYEVQTRLRLPPGRYQIRAAVELESTRQVGSVFTEVVVPDFWRSRLTLAGLMLDVQPRLPSGSSVRMGELVPTTLRDFAPGQSVTVLMQVVQPRAAGLTANVALDSTLLGPDGAQVWRDERVLAAQEFERSGIVDHILSLPLDRLSAGPHLLRVRATGASSASRDLRFEVRLRRGSLTIVESPQQTLDRTVAGGE